MGQVVSSPLAGCQLAVKLAVKFLALELQVFFKPWDKSWKPSLDEARKALVDEIASWIDYVFNAEASEHDFHNGTRDRGRAAGTTLQSFIEHLNAEQAELSPAHVAALRIYTTHLFKYLNGPLRDKSYGFCKKPQRVHPPRSNYHPPGRRAEHCK